MFIHCFKYAQTGKRPTETSVCEVKHDSNEHGTLEEGVRVTVTPCPPLPPPPRQQCGSSAAHSCRACSRRRAASRGARTS